MIDVGGEERQRSTYKTFGFRINALAMATRCFCPPLSIIPLLPTCVERPSLRIDTHRLAELISRQRTRPFLAWCLFVPGGTVSTFHTTRIPSVLGQKGRGRRGREGTPTAVT